MPNQTVLLGWLQLATAGSSHSTHHILWSHLRCSAGHYLEVVPGLDRGQRGRRRCSLYVCEWGRRGVERTHGRASERARIGIRVRLESVQRYATPACMIRPATAGYGRQQSLHPTILHPSHTYTHVRHPLVSPAMQRRALPRGCPWPWSWTARPEGGPVRDCVGAWGRWRVGGPGGDERASVCASEFE